MKAAYVEQVRALIAGGVDVLLVETIFDSLNAKAALVAIREVFDAGRHRAARHDLGRRRARRRDDDLGADRRGALERRGAREAAHHRPQLLARARLDVPVPLGAGRQKSSAAISCYPNAGLPNPLSPTGFDLEPPDMARYLARVRRRAGWSTSPAAAAATRPSTSPRSRARWRTGRPAQSPRRAPEAPDLGRAAAEAPRPLRLSGSQPFTQQPGVFMMIGERTNVAGSPKFAKLIKDGKYEEAVAIARQQVENGANVIDICMDEGMIDGVAAMTRFLSLLASEPEVAKVPFMIDSSKWEVIEAGLKCAAGQGDRQLDLAQGGRGEVPRARPHGARATARPSS